MEKWRKLVVHSRGGQTSRRRSEVLQLMIRKRMDDRGIIVRVA
jgi:hypothetical protein